MILPLPAWRLEVVDEIGSTSDSLIERAAMGEAPRLGLLARRQTQGRGRRGTTWQAARGNLSMSILLRPNWAADEVGRVTLLAGLAMRDALQAYSDRGSLVLKWPNDILSDDGGKLAGILVESAVTAAGGVEWLVIGFGANLAQAPSLPGRRAACLVASGAPPDPEPVARLILGRFDDWMGLMEREGFAAIRAAWIEHAHPIGTVLTADGHPGKFAGLSSDGHLLLDAAEGLTVVRTADVVAGAR